MTAGPTSKSDNKDMVADVILLATGLLEDGQPFASELPMCYIAYCSVHSLDSLVIKLDSDRLQCRSLLPLRLRHAKGTCSM